MHLHLFKHTTRRRKFENEHQPNNRPERTSFGRHRPDVAPTSATATPLSEAESEWPWWLSSPTTEAAPSDPGSDAEADVGRRWSLRQDDSDEPTSPPAA